MCELSPAGESPPPASPLVPFRPQPPTLWWVPWGGAPVAEVHAVGVPGAVPAPRRVVRRVQARAHPLGRAPRPQHGDARPPHDVERRVVSELCGLRHPVARGPRQRQAPSRLSKTTTRLSAAGRDSFPEALTRGGCPRRARSATGRRPCPRNCPRWARRSATRAFPACGGRRGGDGERRPRRRNPGQQPAPASAWALQFPEGASPEEPQPHQRSKGRAPSPSSSADSRQKRTKSFT